MAELGIDHPRAGELIAVANEDSWFTYYYWIYDKYAPDFARTVDIHRKPGYDPAELFLDPKLWEPKLKIAWRLLQKKLGFRMLMDLIPLDATLVKGSHGARPKNISDWPILIGEKTHCHPTHKSKPPTSTTSSNVAFWIENDNAKAARPERGLQSASFHRHDPEPNTSENC